MIQLSRDASCDFIGKRRWAYLASATFILVSLASIVIAVRFDLTGGVAAVNDTIVAYDRVRENRQGSRLPGEKGHGG